MSNILFIIFFSKNKEDSFLKICNCNYNYYKIIAPNKPGNKCAKQKFREIRDENIEYGFIPDKTSVVDSGDGDVVSGTTETCSKKNW